MADRWDAFDVVEGFHLAHAVAALHETGVLDALRSPARADDVATAMGLAPDRVVPLLRYVAERTDLVEVTDAGFRTTDRYDRFARFLLEQYTGAYGPNACRLPELLRWPERAPGAVDRARHARAYADLAQPGLRVLPDVVLQLGLRRVLDLGCGPGALLLELATRDDTFEGWGLDANPAMVETARQRAAAAGMDERVTFFHGDCGLLGAALPPEVCERVETVCAASVVNELFGSGDERVTQWLRGLRDLLPDRALLVADYYGQVGRRTPPWSPLTALHDVVQVISGQGVPPGTHEVWQAIYEEAGCLLVHTIQDEAATFFVHIVRL